jgi:hypothetical protein
VKEVEKPIVPISGIIAKEKEKEGETKKPPLTNRFAALRALDKDSSDEDIPYVVTGGEKPKMSPKVTPTPEK